MRTSSQLALLSLAILTTGCVWRTADEERQMTARCYLRPVGNVAGTSITLEGKRNYTFTIDSDRGKDGARYGVEPGSYRVTVRRGSQILVARVLFIADGETRELAVR